MSPQLNEDLITRIFVETDDLYQAYLVWSKNAAIGFSIHLPKRSPKLSPSEVTTIIVAYHLSGYKCFEYYYHEVILGPYLRLFPDAPSYKRFVCYIVRALPLLFLMLLCKCNEAIRTGHYFIDSKKVEVCHLRREKSHCVFKDYARKGKSAAGWFYGLKLHLVINHLGQAVSFLITPGNVADNNHRVLGHLLAGLKGRCAADKGYYTSLFTQFYEQGLHLLLRPKKNMKGRALPVSNQDVQFMKQRPLIESVNDILATVCDVEHSRHRNPLHGISNILSAVIAYQYLPQKPHVFIPGAINYLAQAA